MTPAAPPTKRSPLSDDDRDAAENLKRLFEDAKTRDGLTQERLAFMMGWKTQSAVSQYLLGKIALNTDAVLKFAAHFKVRPSDIHRKFAALDAVAGAAPAVDDNKVYVAKVHGVSLSGGHGEVIHDMEEVDDTHAFNREWMRKKGLNPARCKLWDVRGDSMYPHYPHGSTVLLNLAQRDAVSGKIFAIVTPDGLRLKRLFRRTDGVWEIHSDNPDKTLYPAEVVTDPERIAIYGQLRWGAKEED